MSLMCAMEKCKAKKGPCVCEKVMGAILVIVAVMMAVRHFKA